MLRSPLVLALMLCCGLAALPDRSVLADTGPAVKRRAPPAAARGEDVLGRAVFQSLVGELALRRGDFQLAAEAWSDLALRTRDPAVLARATEVLAMTRHYERALELADLWQRVEPDSPKPRQMRSTLLVLANRTEELAPQIAQLLAQDKANLPANLMQLNRLLARHADKRVVFRLIERLVQPYLDLPEAHLALAQAALGAGDEARALTAANRPGELRPDWEMAILLKAQLLARQNQGNEAIAGLNGYLRTHPDSADARLLLARLYIGERRLDEARHTLEQLQQQVPDNPEVLYPLAMLTLQQGDAPAGRRLLERLLETDFPDKSAVHYFLGQLAEEQGDREAALTQYQQVLGGEQYVTARARSALLLQKAGRLEAARALLRDTRSENPAERIQLVLAEAQLLREAGRIEEAFGVVEAGLRASPDHLDLLYEAAMLAERLERLTVMEGYLRRLLALKPDHAHALNALGYAFAERNLRLDEAEQLIRQALEAAPDDPYITDSLGWVFFRQGRLDEALATLQRAYRRKADPEIAAHIGEVLWMLGRHDEARRVLTEAQRQHPEHEVLGAVIKKLLP